MKLIKTAAPKELTLWGQSRNLERTFERFNALRCFISLRGAVCQLRCDQGTNFVGAKNEFKEALKQCDTAALEACLADKQCEFILNALSASHTGGVWERQIRTIRNVMNVTITQSSGRLDDASLRTLFYEAMAIGYCDLQTYMFYAWSVIIV